MTERIWIILSAALIIVAAAFLWRNNTSGAFVTATLGAVAWFLSYRVQLRGKIVAAERESNEQESYEPDEE